MIGLDSNVIIRLLTNDDPVQAERAAALIASETVYVPKTVLMETEWVLRYTYELDRRIIHTAILRFLGLPQVTVEDAGAVHKALEGYAAGLDLADALHVASASPAASFATFDQSLRKQASRLPGGIPIREPNRQIPMVTSGEAS